MPPAKALIAALIEEKSKLGDKAVWCCCCCSQNGDHRQATSWQSICVAFRLLVWASIVQLETSSPQCDTHKHTHAVYFCEMYACSTVLHSIDQSFDRTGRGYFLQVLLDLGNRQVVCYTLQTKPSCIAKPATGTEWLENVRKRRQRADWADLRS